MGLFDFMKKKTPEVKTPEAKPKTAEELYQEANALDYRRQDEALALWKQAAKMGHCEAQYECGNHYFYSDDYAMALYWFEKAAAQGKIFAMRRCSELYHGKKGVEENPEKVFYWRKKWAEAGDTDGMFELAISYRDGYGTEKDLSNVVHWFEKATEKGVASAANALGGLYSNGKWLSPDAVKALYWYEKAVELHHNGALCSCAQMYYNGEGTEVNKAKALQLYKKAAEVKEEDAMLPLARMLASGEGDKQADVAEAMFWCWMADQNRIRGAADLLAELVKGFSGARASHWEMLGMAAYEGLGSSVDKEKALHFFKKAAACGSADAQYNCSVMYDQGEGTPASRLNTKRAFFWAEMAAKQGQASAQYNCAVMYLHGQGTEKNKEKAKMRAQKSAAQGSEKATDMLTRL